MSASCIVNATELQSIIIEIDRILDEESPSLGNHQFLRRLAVFLGVWLLSLW